MPDDIRDILVEIIDSYGIKILEDPDRLAQFLEDRSSLRPEDTFHLTFALRFLLKCGWRPSRREYMKEGADYRASLESQLGFTKEQAAEVMKLINWLMEMEYGGSEGEAETGAVVAVPGNLKKIAGGVANRPRTMRIRKKSLYNGIILIVSLAVLAGIITFALSAAGVLAGKKVGSHFGRKAEYVGGGVLLIIAARIILQAL